jgi:hypothetical protein
MHLVFFHYNACKDTQNMSALKVIIVNLLAFGCPSRPPTGKDLCAMTFKEVSAEETKARRGAGEAGQGWGGERQGTVGLYPHPGTCSYRKI